MKREGALKHFLLALLLALGGYVLFYHGIEHWRTRRGPWQVTFTTSTPAIAIAQPRLGITNVQIRFVGPPPSVTNTAGDSLLRHSQADFFASNHPSPSTTLRFSQLRAVPYDLPFGKCIFLDTTSLPGTVVLQLFGHEIELLPRTLVIDRQERPWRSGEAILLPR